MSERPLDSDVPPRSAASTDEAARRSARTRIGVPAVIALVAVGSVPFVLDTGGDDGPLRAADVATPTVSSTAPAAGVSGPDTVQDSIFTPAGATSADAQDPTAAVAGTTVRTTTATAVPTNVEGSVAGTVAQTLPAQPSGPIVPPDDPRGFEEQVVLGGISIPKLGVEAPLLQGIRLTTLDEGPGHWPGTARPGEVGNVVVAGHRTSHGGPFRNIDQLVEGDVVLFDTDDGEIEYTVTGTQIVDPDAIWIVDPTDTPTATLFACHPPGSVAQRIVVKLELSA